MTTGTHTYRVLVTQDAGCFVQSSDQVITVADDPTVGISTVNPNICEGGTALLSATVTGGAGTSNYQWQYNDAGTWTNVGTDQN